MTIAELIKELQKAEFQYGPQTPIGIKHIELDNSGNIQYSTVSVRPPTIRFDCGLLTIEK